MNLKKNTYTTRGLLKLLSEKYRTKKNGKSFNLNDVHEYLRRGSLPFKYGGNKLTRLEDRQNNLLLISLGEQIRRVPRQPNKKKTC